jgi:malate dehydrogenase
MERKDLLTANGLIFKNQAKVIQDNADPNVRIAVVGNPANTNAAILAEYAPKIPKENITAMTRLDQNRAQGQIAHRLNTNVENVKNVMIWGNHSLTQYPDIRYAVVNVNGKQEKVSSHITDLDWVHNTFIPLVQKRGGQIISMRKASSAASAAAALCDHVHDWVVGTHHGETVAMGVMSDGSYGVPKGLNFSFPVTCTNGSWRIVQGYEFKDEYSKAAMAKTLKELTDEKNTAMEFLQSQK